MAYRLWDNCSKKRFPHLDTFSSEKNSFQSTCLQARPLMLAPFSQISVLRQHFTLGFFSVARVLKKRRQRRRWKWQKSNRLRLVMNNISLFLCTFLIRRCTTTTYNFLISRFQICACSGIVALEFDRIVIYYSKGSFPCRHRCFKLPFILEIASSLSSWRDLWASAVFFFFLFWRLSREKFGNKPPRKYPLYPTSYVGWIMSRFA